MSSFESKTSARNPPARHLIKANQGCQGADGLVSRSARNHAICALSTECRWRAQLAGRHKGIAGPPHHGEGGTWLARAASGKARRIGRPAALRSESPFGPKLGLVGGWGGVGVGGLGGLKGEGGGGGGRGLFRGRGLSTASRGPFERPLTRPLEGRSGSRWGPPESGPCRLWTPRSESSTPVLLQSACPPATGAPWVSGACSGGRGGGKGLFQSGAAVRAWATPQLAQGPVRWVDKGTAPLVLCNR